MDDLTYFTPAQLTIMALDLHATAEQARAVNAPQFARETDTLAQACAAQAREMELASVVAGE